MKRPHTFFLRYLGAVLLLTVLCGILSSCAPKKEVILVTAEGRRAAPAQFDEDAFVLLPPGAVMWWRVDAKAAWNSSFGDSLAQRLEAYLPFASGAGVDLRADMDLVVGALYATVGSDVVAISQGRFDAAKIEKAVASNPTSVGGQEIQTSVYAGATMYVAAQAAMAILSEKTLVFGTQLGVRRVLEQVEEGRLKRDLPPWYEALLTQGGADMQWGIDLDSQPVPAAFRTQLTFLNELRAARLLGNFRAPGFNLAGSLSYDRPQGASKAAAELMKIEESLERYEMVLTALRIPQPISSLQARAIDKEAQLAVEFEGGALQAILDAGPKLWEKGGSDSWLPN